VAESIAKAADTTPFAPGSEDWRRALAIAAVEALVEPTPEMVEAAEFLSVRLQNCDEAAIWRQMVRSALAQA